jgi:nitroreductase
VQKNINDIIRDRRSIYPREFTGNILDISVVETLLENANQAPNHKSNYPWRFVVIAGDKLSEWLHKAAEIYTNNTPAEKFKQEKVDKIMENISQISHAIAIVMHTDEEAKTMEVEDICAVACSVQNMYLSLDQFEHAGGYWSTGLGTYSPVMKDYLGLESNEKLMGYFILGEISVKRTEGHKKEYKKFVRYL